jgi:16S rRNA (cytosine1402-N4)-methyltransferase
MIARSERAEEEVAQMRHQPGEHDPGRAHTPVLVQEVLNVLGPLARLRHGWLVDATLGAGGHTRAVLEAFPGLSVLGIDQDPAALEEARRTLAGLEDRTVLRRGRMSQMAELCADESVSEIVGVLFDLGASSMHFDRPERGFSLQADGPLDMRMDPARDRTAADIVNRWDEADLADLFYYEGGERRSRRIAQAIVEERQRVPFLRTGALADLVARVGGERGGRIHPATKVFQALRRAVNEEGDELLHGLQAAEALLASGGRLVVLTFHSGEDGMVKRFLSEGKRGSRWSPIAKKPVGPGSTERLANPRSRSARMRAAQRVRATAPRGSRFDGDSRP